MAHHPTAQATPAAAADEALPLGLLLFMVPPAGLLTLWSSGRYTSEAKFVVSGLTALWMCLATAVVMTLMLVA